LPSSYYETLSGMPMHTGSKPRCPYDSVRLRLRICDDGKGIDPKVLQGGGRAGHWGLRGIRERTKQIDPRLDFWSEAGAGTELS
jgi:signal transduction histidine kinase